MNSNLGVLDGDDSQFHILRAQGSVHKIQQKHMRKNYFIYILYTLTIRTGLPSGFIHTVHAIIYKDSLKI